MTLIWLSIGEFPSSLYPRTSVSDPMADGYTAAVHEIRRCITVSFHGDALAGFLRLNETIRPHITTVLLLKFMYLVFLVVPLGSLFTFYLLACQVRVTVPLGSLCTLYVLACQVRVNVPLVEFLYFVFTHMAGASYRASRGVCVFTRMPGERYHR